MLSRLENWSASHHYLVHGASELLQVFAWVCDGAYDQIRIHELPIGTISILVKQVVMRGLKGRIERDLKLVEVELRQDELAHLLELE